MGSLVLDTPTRTASAQMPNWCVEVLFPWGANQSDGDWTDVTPRVQSVHIVSGRSRELDRFESATCEVDLRNNDRIFDPDYTPGPFYPWLKSLRQIRVSGTWNGVRYPAFRGNIDSWPQTTIEDVDGVVKVSAHDGLKGLEQVPLPGSMYEFVVGKDPPVHWWRLDEAADLSTVTDGGSAAPLPGFASNVTFGTAGLLLFDGSRTCAAFDGLSSSITLPNSVANTLATYSLEFWFSHETFTTTLEYAVVIGDRVSTTGAVGGAMEIGGLLVLIAGDASFVTSTAYDDGNAHQVVITSDGSTASFYIDGALASTGAVTVPLVNGVSTIGDSFNCPWVGNLQEIPLWDHALTAAQVTEHFNAGSLGLTGEGTGTAISRILDFAGWPTNRRSIEVGSSLVGGYDLTAGSGLDRVNSLADTERSFTYVDGDGIFVHIARHTILTGTTSTVSQATYGDFHSSSPTARYVDILPVRDETLIYPTVGVTRQGGFAQSYTDPTSEGQYGIGRRLDITGLLFESDNDAFDCAAYLVALYKGELTRFEQITVDPMINTAWWPEVFRAFGQRVTVDRTPQGVGSPIDQQVLLEGREITATMFDCEVILRASPAETRTFGVWGTALWSDANALWTF